MDRECPSFSSPSTSSLPFETRADQLLSSFTRCRHLELVLRRRIPRSLLGRLPLPLSIHQHQGCLEVSFLFLPSSLSISPLPSRSHPPKLTFLLAQQNSLPRLPRSPLKRHTGCQHRQEGEGIAGLPRVRLVSSLPPSPSFLSSSRLCFAFVFVVTGTSNPSTPTSSLSSRAQNPSRTSPPSRFRPRRSLKKLGRLGRLLGGRRRRRREQRVRRRKGRGSGVLLVSIVHG